MKGLQNLADLSSRHSKVRMLKTPTTTRPGDGHIGKGMGDIQEIPPDSLNVPPCPSPMVRRMTHVSGCGVRTENRVRAGPSLPRCSVPKVPRVQPRACRPG